MTPKERLQTALDAIVRRSQTADAGALARLPQALDAGDLEAIKLLGQFGVLSMRDLAEQLRIPASTATSLVDRLEKKGLVERSRNAADRRVIQLSLTAEGREALNAVTQEHLRLCQELLESFGPQEQTVLADLLERLAVKPPKT
ncbi:MAG: MarR family transcriptional regulator [Pseudomonadota bacterium]